MEHSGKSPSTKSDSVAVGDWDERVSARKLVKQPVRPSAVRSTPPSKNSPCAGLLSPLLFVYAHGTEVAPPLTIANVEFGTSATACRLPVASLPTQRNPLMVDVEPPWVKSR